MSAEGGTLDPQQGASLLTRDSLSPLLCHEMEAYERGGKWMGWAQVGLSGPYLLLMPRCAIVE